MHAHVPQPGDAHPAGKCGLEVTKDTHQPHNIMSGHHQRKYQRYVLSVNDTLYGGLEPAKIPRGYVLSATRPLDGNMACHHTSRLCHDMHD